MATAPERGITIFGLEDADLPALELLMDRYRDRPMDFADATLVQMATKRTLVDILTYRPRRLRNSSLVGRTEISHCSRS